MIARHLRRLVPAPVRRADIALYRLVARTHLPVLGSVLPKLSKAANHSVLWTALAATMAAVGGRFGRRAGLRGMMAVAISSALTNIPAKLLTGRTRPDLRVVPEARLLPRVPTTTSFPSGHSASALAFATGASLEDPRLRWPLRTLAGAVAFSRVYTGVHYPGDVAAGAAIGVAMGRLTTRVWPLASTLRASAAPAAPEALPEPDGTGMSMVANAGAGNVLAPGPAAQLERELPGARLVEVEPDDDFASVLLRACEQGVALGVAGGDGSASAAAAVAQAAGKPLALVPAGTLNHLAGDLGLDAVAATAQAVHEGRTIAMDMAEIDGRPFVNAASIGGYPHLVQHRERLESRIGKWPAVLVSLVRLLFSSDPIRLSLDGRERRIWMVFVGNCRFDAMGLAPTRRSRLDDGLLDVRMVHAERSWARVRVLVSALTGRLGRCRVYEQHLVRELHVRSGEGPLQLARDGETFDGSEEFVIRKLDEPLIVFQPSGSVPVRR